MKKSTTIHFVRHGHVHNPQLILYGRMKGYFLSDEGVEQAKHVAKALSGKPIAAIFSSPMERTIQTAEEIVNKFPGMDLKISPLINEVHCPHEGVPLSEIIRMKFDVYTGSPPPYEQPQDLIERGLAFIEMVRREYYGKEVVACTHGDTIAFLMLFAMNKPILFEEKEKHLKNYIGHASIASLTFKTDDPAEIPAYTYFIPYKED